MPVTLLEGKKADGSRIVTTNLEPFKNNSCITSNTLTPQISNFTSRVFCFAPSCAKFRAASYPSTDIAAFALLAKAAIEKSPT